MDCGSGGSSQISYEQVGGYYPYIRSGGEVERTMTMPVRIVGTHSGEKELVRSPRVGLGVQ